MKRILSCAMLASLLVLSACRSDKDTTPPPAEKPASTAAAPAKPAAPVEAAKPAQPVEPAKEAAKSAAEPVKPPVEAAKPPVETAKPPADTAKPPVETTKPPTDTAKPPVETPKPATKPDMDADIKVLMAKPEVADQSIEIQHILISFKGAPRMPASVTRSKEEAKALAEKIYAEIVAGGNFDALVKQHTNDSHPGIYPMTKAGRGGMVKGFGDVGFRLKVGEIGVAPWDASASPYGWHIIKRLK